MLHDGYGFYQFKTCFCEFNSIDDIFYLIYSEKINVLICYDIIKKKIINRVIKSNGPITDIRHYLDNKLKRDLILNSFKRNEIEVSNLQNWESLLKISNVNESGFLFSSCFFNDNNNIYILTTKNKVTTIGKCENIKVFDMKKKKIKEIYGSNKDTFYIDNYYDSKLNENFIVTCNRNHINIFSFQKSLLFKKYNAADCGEINDFIVDERGSIKKLLGSCYYGIIIWDFYTGKLLKQIMSNIGGIYGLCLFNNNYLLAGNNNYIILIDLINEKIVNKISSNQEKEISRIKAIDTKNGKIFICGGRWECDIIFLENKELKFSIKNRIRINNIYL